MKRKIFFKDLIIACFAIPLIIILKRVPIEISGGFFGFILKFIGPKIKTHNLLLKNIDIIFPKITKDEKKKLAKKAWYNLGFFLIEELKSDDKKFFSKINLHGEEKLQKAIADQKGIIVFSPHLGSITVMGIGIKLAIKEKKQFLIYRRTNNRYVNDFLCKMRKKYVLEELIEKNFRAPLKIVNALKNKNIVYMLLDHKLKEGRKVNFFNKKAYTPVSLSVFSKLKNVSIFPMYSVRKFNKNKISYDVFIEDEVKFSGVKEKDALKMNRIFEGMVKKCPEQFFTLFHNRWD